MVVHDFSQQFHHYLCASITSDTIIYFAVYCVLPCTFTYRLVLHTSLLGCDIKNHQHPDSFHLSSIYIQIPRRHFVKRGSYSVIPMTPASMFSQSASHARNHMDSEANVVYL